MGSRFFRFALPVVFVLLCIAMALAPALALAQDGGAPPVADPIFSTLTDLVSHAKLGRTVLAIVLAVKLVIEILRRLGKRLPGAVGAWFAGPVALWVLPLAAGLVGGVATTLANGGSLVDGLIGGVLVGIGAWLPTSPPPAVEPPAALTTTAAVDAFNGKGPKP